ncbi:hypothetical protein [Aminobacter sp. SR38]|uniref:hypothetical protein n=1 Tax=Aminobacter sp. SR38 TaxID=2774562 RepID=UPI001FF04322|nr:hypothetical protein [Aminobacter sp. SR38]
MDSTHSLTPVPQADAKMEEERLRRAIAAADADLAAGQAQKDEAVLRNLNGASLMPDFMDNMQQSIGGGMAKAVFEAKDFLVGEPAEADKSPMRRSIEAADRALDRKSAGYGLASGVSQLAVGLIGAGKLMAPLKATQKFQQGGKFAASAFEVGRGTVAGGIVLDPHEERLSNLIESFPDLQNPVTAFLAAAPDDTPAEGRFKNALESIGADLALLGAVKVIKFLRSGQEELAIRELAKLEKARGANADEFGMDFADRSLPDAAAIRQQADIVNARQANVDEFGMDFTPTVQPASKDEPATALGIPGQAAPDAPASATVTRPGAPSETPRAEAVIDPHRPVAPVEASTVDTETILKRTESDVAAISKYGSREAAAEAGEAMTKGNRLPWQKLRTTEGLRAFLTNAEQTLRGQMDEAKGGAIMSDANVNAKVRQMAEYFGDEPDILIGQITEAGAGAAQMVSKMEAGYLTANAMTQDAYTTATKLRHGLLDEWGGDAAKAAETLRSQVLTSMTLLASARSISSNSGRALRRMRGGFKITPEDLAKVKTMDPEQLAKVFYATGGDPKKLAQAVSPGFLRRVTDEGAFLLSNNLLWLWPTHLMNVTSSAMMIVGRPTEKLLGSFAVGPQTGNTMRRQALKEYSATVAALGDGWTAMVEAFKRGDSLLSPHSTEVFQSGSLGAALPRIQWKPIKTVSDFVDNALNAANYRNLIGLPTRTLGAVDEFFKTLRYRAVVQAEAAVEAAERGLTGKDYHAFVARRLEDSIDPATGRALDERALREAQVTTFQQELLPQTFGATVQQVRSRHPLLHLVLPFVKTPINVLRYGVKMTPGLNLIQKEYLGAIRGAAGPEGQAQAVGQMALGSVFMGLAATLALSGKLTGAGPTDPEVRRHLTASGWQPFSYVVENEDGTRTYVPLSKADPVGLSLSMVATIVEAMQVDPEADMEVSIAALGYALAKNFADRTFLANVNQAVQALSEPEKRGGKWLGNTLGNLVPASSLIRGTNPDPYLREARSVLDTALKDIPGYSKTLPARRDAFGEPLFRRVGLITHDDADLVETEHNRMILETGKAGIGSPSPEFEGLDLRDITLTEGPNEGRNAYEVLQELSAHIPGQPSLKYVLGGIIESETYQDMPDGDPDVKGTRLWALGEQAERYRRAAKKYLVIQNVELQKLIGARQREASAARLEKRRQREGDVPATFSEMLQPQR